MVFKKGHPAYYRGGSVLGHLPTNPNGHPPTYLSAKRFAEGGDMHEHSFSQPRGFVHAEKGRMTRKKKSKDRTCMEALQNLDEITDEAIERTKLYERFPKGMVDRLRRLQEVAENPDHRDFMHANRLVREILTQKLYEDEARGGDGAAAEGDSITVTRGRAVVAMPGEPGAPIESDPADGE